MRIQIKQSSFCKTTVQTNARGVALFLVLIFVGIVAFALVSSARFIADTTFAMQARAAGDEALLLARAARIAARDEFALNGMGTVPRLVNIADMVNNNLLPATFGRPTGGVFTNALGQQMTVMYDNIDGVLGAYVVLSPSPRYAGTEAERAMTIVSQQLRAKNLPLNSPTFNAGGRIFMACGSGTPVANTVVSSWDTGCLTAAQYAGLRAVSAATLPNLTGLQGVLIIPSWRAYTPDTRTFSRYAQPENPGAATMATDLYVAQAAAGASPCIGSNLQVRRFDGMAADLVTPVIAPEDYIDANGNTVCRVRNDTAVLDRRYDINNVNNVTASAAIVERQGARFGGNVPTMGTNTAAINGALAVTGNTQVLGFDGAGAITPLRSTGVGVAPVINGPVFTNSNLTVSGTTSIGSASSNSFSTATLNANAGPGSNGYNVGVIGPVNTGALTAGTPTAGIQTGTFNSSGAVTVDNANFATARTTGGLIGTRLSTSTDWSTPGNPVTTTNAPVIIGEISGNSAVTVLGTTNAASVETDSAATVRIKRVDTNICASENGGKCPFRPKPCVIVDGVNTGPPGCVIP